MEVRYAARPVMVLFALVPVDSVDVSALLEDENEANGSVFSLPGEVAAADILAADACLEPALADFELGEAKRERVFKKVDLRLVVGVGRVDTSIGRAGSLALGCESRSLW